MRRRGLRYKTERPEGDIEPDLLATHLEAIKRMEQFDSMPSDVRDLINEFNTNAVVDAYQMGFTTVEAIRNRLLRQRRDWLQVQMNDAERRNPRRTLYGDRKKAAGIAAPEADRTLRRPVGPRS